MGNNQGSENNFRIQAKKQHKKQMPISVVNVTICLLLCSSVWSSSGIINDPGQLMYLIMLWGPACVRKC